MWQRRGSRLILVLCPKSVISVWSRQIREHLNVDHVIYTSQACIEHAKTRKEFVNAHVDAITFLIINYEQTPRGERWLRRVPWDILICDEIHRLKSRNGKQSKVVARIGKSIRNKYGLTGTPIATNELDLWPQFRVLRPDLLGTNWKKFSKRWCNKTGWEGRKYKLKKHKTGEFYDRIAPHTFQLKEDEIPNIPSADLIIDFELTGKARRAYKELEEQYYTKYKDMEVLTELAVTNMLRLQQLTGGFLDNGEEIAMLEQNKLITMMDFISDIPKSTKLVIYARFTPEIDVIREAIKKCGRSIVVLDGRTKTRDRDSWETFQDKRHPEVYLSQIRAGGLGIELSVSDIEIFFSNSFSFIDYSQARARIEKRNQKSKNMYYHLHGINTIDNDIFNSLRSKNHTANGVMNELKQRMKSYG